MDRADAKEFLHIRTASFAVAEEALRRPNP